MEIVGSPPRWRWWGAEKKRGVLGEGISFAGSSQLHEWIFCSLTCNLVLCECGDAMSAPNLLALNIQDHSVARTLLTLQRRAYRAEADLIGFDRIPGLMEDLDGLLHCGEEFLGCFEGGQIVAAISWKRDAHLVDIHRLVVDPVYTRKGLARRLLQSVLTIPGIKRVVVSTAGANTPACRLYESEGFRQVEWKLVEGGVVVVGLEKIL